MNDKTKKPKRKVIPEGFQVRRKLGRDEELECVRIQLTFSFSEWDEIETKALESKLYPSEWIKYQVLKEATDHRPIR